MNPVLLQIDIFFPYDSQLTTPHAGIDQHRIKYFLTCGTILQNFLDILNSSQRGYTLQYSPTISGGSPLLLLSVLVMNN